MDKNTTYLVIALVLVLVLFSPESKRGAGAGRRPPGPTYGRPAPYPIAGPSPLGTSYAQNGPVGATHQSNGYDLGIAAIDAGVDIFTTGAKQGWFDSSDDGYNNDPAPAEPDTYDTDFVDSLPF